MQEEVTNKTIALSVRTVSFTAHTLQAVVRAVSHRHDKAVRASGYKAIPKGEQTLKELVGSNATLTNVNLDKTNLSLFRKAASKYGVDFAVTKEKGTSPPRYLVFFKGKDIDVITAAFKEISKTKIPLNERGSIRQTLNDITRTEQKLPKKEMEKAKTLPQKKKVRMKNRIKARGLIR